MRSPIVMLAMLTLLGCAVPQREAFAPARANSAKPVAQPAQPAHAQDCPARRRHHKFEYADFAGADLLLLRPVVETQSDRRSGAAGTHSGAAENEAGCLSQRRTVYA
jgi:hypothetical protein